MPTVEPIIELRNLHVRFGLRDVIRDLELTVEPGEFVSIVGRSGCGKSTLLNALAGFIPSEGQVRIPESFGYIFQSYNAFPWLTVRKNVLFGMPKNLSPKDRAERLSSLLKSAGLSAEADKYPAELSGGQVQRVAIARALARDPGVILMDEPFGALDNYTRETMQTWLLDLYQRHSQTILFVTHNIEEAIFLSDRIVVLADGAVRVVLNVPFARPREKNLMYELSFVEMKRSIQNILETI
jgi:NitT/TauT family transport system ATP-binding protein